MTKYSRHDCFVLLLSILFTTLYAAPQKRSGWKSDYTFVYIYGPETPETSDAALSTAVASISDPGTITDTNSDVPSTPLPYPTTDAAATIDKLSPAIDRGSGPSSITSIYPYTDTPTTTDESSPIQSLSSASPTAGQDGTESVQGEDPDQGQESRSDPDARVDNADCQTLTTLTEVFTLGSVTPTIILAYSDSTNTIQLGLETDTSPTPSRNIPTRAFIANVTVTPVPRPQTSHPSYIIITSPFKPIPTTSTSKPTHTPSTTTPLPTTTTTSTLTPPPTTLTPQSITPAPQTYIQSTPSIYDIDAIQTSYYQSVCSWPEHVDDAICLSDNTMMCCRSDNERCAAVLEDGGLSCKGIQSGDWATTWTRPTVTVTVTAATVSPSVRPTPGRKRRRWGLG